MAADPTPSTNLSLDPVVEEARKRFDACAEFEAIARKRMVEDLKFAEGDDENRYQWPNAITKNRDVDERPCLTLNITRQHNLQIINDMAQRKVSAKILGVGNGATQESANVMRDIIRRIEYQSDAQHLAFKFGREFQVKMGIGWWRIVTRYESDDTYDQDLYLTPVFDPLSVYSDPEAWFNRMEMKFAFVFDTLPRDEFESAYPEFAQYATLQPLGVSASDNDWMGKDHIRVAEYFRRVPRPDKLVQFRHQGERVQIRKSMMHSSMLGILDDPLTRVRDICPMVVEWKLIIGEKVCDETEWVGSRIPLIPCLGEQSLIEGILDVKGHTRGMKSAQRMYNFNASGQIEFVALQSKTPYIADAKSIEEYQNYWDTANRVNHSVLPYNSVDEENPEIVRPAPQRQEPPQQSPAFESGMQTAFNQMMMTSGQWQNQMGMQGNERTGAAIEKRQDQSDTSVYHFQDNYEFALINTYKQLIECSQVVYNTRRLLMIQADDGTDMEIEVDPGAKQVWQVERAHDKEVLKRVLNPRLGRYDVAATIGPSYGSKRQQTQEALTLILTQNPGLTGIIGDLLMKCFDIDEAQEAALRLKRMVPPQALGEGPTQQEQEQQQQIQQLGGALTKALQQQGVDHLKLVGKSEMRDIDSYKAETDRMKALAEMLPTDPAGLRQIIEQLVNDAMQTSLLPIIKANQTAGADGDDGTTTAAATAPPALPAAPMPGAQRAGDGQWYILDPTRRGKYLRIAPLAQERRPGGVISNG